MAYQQGDDRVNSAFCKLYNQLLATGNQLLARSKPR